MGRLFRAIYQSALPWPEPMPHLMGFSLTTGWRAPRLQAFYAPPTVGAYNPSVQTFGGVNSQATYHDIEMGEQALYPGILTGEQLIRMGFIRKARGHRAYLMGQGGADAPTLARGPGLWHPVHPAVAYLRGSRHHDVK